MKFIDIINEEAIDKDVKKAKLLYKVFKTGIYKLDIAHGTLYKYVLSDDYEITTHEQDGEKKVLIEPVNVDMYFESWDKDLFKVLDKKEYPSIERWMIRLIRKKFAQHNVDIVII
jgi:hypothetical protein